MQWKQPIAYPDSWMAIIKIAGAMGCLTIAIMVLLQPFDTYQTEVDLKALKLSGYALGIALPIVMLHAPAKVFFERSNRRWTLLNELVYLAGVAVLTALMSHIYHEVVFADGLWSFRSFGNFFLYFTLPFFPIFLPLLAYLRYSLGKVSVDDTKISENLVIEVFGENRDESLKFLMSRFVFAEAQQNYVDVFILDEGGQLKKEIIRSTFSKLAEQVPLAPQVHRSFLVNIDFIDAIQGNSRRRLLKLKGLERAIPVSKKYFQALQNSCQIRP